MTRLEAIEKIRKLPKLKRGYEYVIDEEGFIGIEIHSNFTMIVFKTFTDFFINRYHLSLKEYELYFTDHIYDKDNEIVGYE